MGKYESYLNYKLLFKIKLLFIEIFYKIMNNLNIN